MNKHFRTAIGIILSVALLYWALRDVSFAEVSRQIRQADYFLFTLAVAGTLVGFWIRAVRWGILLLPVAGKVPFKPRLAATFVGFAVNNILPARLGEVARVYSLARLTEVPAGSAFATLVIERLLDGLVLVGLLFFVMARPSFPSIADGGVDFSSGALLVALIMGGMTAGLYFAVVSPARAGKFARTVTGMFPGRLRDPAVSALRSFANGLGVLRNPRLFWASMALALGQWVFLAVSFLLAFRAFRIDTVPFAGAVFLQSLIALAVAIPSSPGFFGPFEAGARVGLAIYEVPADQAVSFAIGFHIGGFLPVTIIGIWYIWRLRLGWAAVRRGQSGVDPQTAESGDPTRV